MFSDADGTIGRALSRLRGRNSTTCSGAIVTAVLCLTRFLSPPVGIAGVGETLEPDGNCFRVGGGQPVQLYLLALLIYEPIAVFSPSPLRGWSGPPRRRRTDGRVVRGGVCNVELLRRAPA